MTTQVKPAREALQEIMAAPEGAKPDSWERRHEAVWFAYRRNPFAAAIRSLMTGAAEYIDASETLGWKIADDCVLGICVARILDSVRGLLDGEKGDLDGGKLWSGLELLAKRGGWEDLDAVTEAAR